MHSKSSLDVELSEMTKDCKNLHIRSDLTTPIGDTIESQSVQWSFLHDDENYPQGQEDIFIKGLLAASSSPREPTWLLSVMSRHRVGILVHCMSARHRLIILFFLWKPKFQLKLTPTLYASNCPMRPTGHASHLVKYSKQND